MKAKYRGMITIATPRAGDLLHMQTIMKIRAIIAVGLGFALGATGCRTQLYTRKYRVLDPSVIYSEDVVSRFGERKRP